ncbi:hypothetical protein GQ42DRAFT_179700 [Ramicandelaber brevisporus]|nr:hypothetical protein GQ42DRAFT_179700 [Ramicandelaber brevisporus]
MDALLIGRLMRNGVIWELILGGAAEVKSGACLATAGVTIAKTELAEGSLLDDCVRFASDCCVCLNGVVAAAAVVVVVAVIAFGVFRNDGVVKPVRAGVNESDLCAPIAKPGVTAVVVVAVAAVFASAADAIPARLSDDCVCLTGVAGVSFATTFVATVAVAAEDLVVCFGSTTTGSVVASRTPSMVTKYAPRSNSSPASMRLSGTFLSALTAGKLYSESRLPLRTFSACR